MKFPNAYRGIKKIFIAELVALIAALLAIVSSTMVIAAKENEAILLSAGTVALVSSIVLVVCLVIEVIGLHQAGKDDTQIGYAFFLTILAIVLGLTGSILEMFKETATAASMVNAGVNVARVVALELTLLGVATLAKKLGNNKMAALGKILAWCVCILYVISIMFRLYPNFLNSSVPEWLKTMSSITAILAGVAELVVSVLLVVYYGKATKMLKK